MSVVRSHLSPPRNSRIAQLVDRRTDNSEAAGSIPAPTTKSLKFDSILWSVPLIEFFMNAKAIGEVSEVMILAALVSRGYVVSKPFGDNQRYDLVVETPEQDGVLKRVQCKTGKLYDGVVKFSCSNRVYNGERRNYKGQADLFAVFCPQNSCIYLVNVDEFGDFTGSLRVTYPKNGQTTGIQWASKYVLGDIPADHFTPGRDQVPECSPVLTDKILAARDKRRQITLSAEELRELVWSKPMRDVAKDLGVSDVAVKKSCLRLGIETPKRGHWLQK